MLRYRFVAATGLGILLAVTDPFLEVHFELPIPATAPRPNRNPCDLIADGFGPGLDGPLLSTVNGPEGSLESHTGATALADRVAASLHPAPEWQP